MWKKERQLGNGITGWLNIWLPNYENIKTRWIIKISTLTRTSLLCTRSYESEWLNGFLTVLFNLRSLVAALLKSKKNRRGMAWSCCCWSMSMSMSIKNSSSCAQANNIGNTADNVKTNWWLHWQVVTSPFNRAKKKLTRVSRDWPNPHLARDHVNVKFDAELTRVRAQPGVV